MPSPHQSKSYRRSKILPAIPPEERSGTSARAPTVSSRGDSHTVSKLVTPPDEGPPSPLQPRPRTTSSQRSPHRDYFVYTDPNTETPFLHLRGHRRSSTLPHVPVRDLPVQHESRSRSHSVGDHARPRVEDKELWSDGSQQQHGSDDTPLTVTHIDSSTPTDKIPETLPTIPGSSASSQGAIDSQPPSPPPRNREDTTDTQPTPTRSLSTPVRSPARRSIDHRQFRDSTDPSNHASSPTTDSFNSRVHIQGQRRTISERRTLRHSGTIKGPQTALAVGQANTRSDDKPDQDEPLAEYRYWDLPPSPPLPELPEKAPYNTSGYRVVNPDPPTPPRPERRPQVPQVRGETLRVDDHPNTPPITENKNGTPANLGLGPEDEDPSTVTQYMKMLLAMDKIPQIYNLAASFFTWILLAGFVLFPGTFTSLRNQEGSNVIAQGVLNVVNNVSLFVIAFLCCGIGAAGMGYLWWRWMNNYVWLVNRVFLPGLLHSLAGLLSTFSSVYGAQHGQYSTSSEVTLIVTASTTFICGVLTLYYLMWKIRRIKTEHDGIIGKQRAGKYGEGLIERIKRKASERSITIGTLV
ncbi:hypothetical protein F5887DRAFT_1131131 [Amanita rubescens]|nr:hypothetical protein F5887DRAFT_1131131 [Amanita rubescens]